MAKTPFPNPIQYLVGGSNPSLFSEISDELTENYLVIDDSLVPCHGKKNPRTLNGKILRAYKSFKDNTVYIFSTNQCYTLSATGSLQPAFVLSNSTGYIQVDENNNSELGITTGSALYIYNYGSTPPVSGRLSQVPVVDADGFRLHNPATIICIDNFFFVGDSHNQTVQISAANNGLLWDPVQTFKFASVADDIVSLGTSKRVLMIGGVYSTERYVVNGGASVVTRDNVFLEKFGFYDKNSIVNSNKLDFVIGMFQDKKGGKFIKILEQGQFRDLASPGIVKQILAAGKIINSDVYTIDSIQYYELVCTKRSFIYNFTNQTWTYSTNEFEQVVSIGGKDYVGSGSELYDVDYYNTQKLKRRVCPNSFLAPEFNRFTVNQVYLWFSNKFAVTGEIMMGASTDSVTNIITEQKKQINNQSYYSAVTREFDIDCFQFSLYFETYANVIFRGFAASASIGGPLI